MLQAVGLKQARRGFHAVAACDPAMKAAVQALPGSGQDGLGQGLNGAKTCRKLFLRAPRTCTMLRAGRAGGATKVPVQLLRMMSFTMASVILRRVQGSDTEGDHSVNAAHAGFCVDSNGLAEPAKHAKGLDVGTPQPG